jgi:hypothetical protein
LLVVYNLLLQSLDLIKLVHISIAVSFSVEDKELSLLLIELNILKMTISGNLDFGRALKINRKVLKIEGFNHSVCNWVNYVKFSAICVAMMVVSHTSLNLLN